MAEIPTAPPQSSVPDEILRLRHRGSRGGVIGKHRALITLNTSRLGVVVGLAMGAAFSFAVLLALPTITTIWIAFFRFWHQALRLPGEVVTLTHGWRPYLLFDVPTVTLPAAEVAAAIWWTSVGIVLILLVVSFPLARKILPLAYLLRAVVLIQGSALVYFALRGDRLPYDIGGYTLTMLLASLSLVAVAPLLLGLTYNVYDVGVGRKLLLALLVELHLVVFLPHQYLLHAVLVHHGSFLFLPVLYFLFGLLVDVLVLVAWYSWGMYWPEVLKEG